VERKKTAFLHAHAVQLLLWMWYPADYNEAVKLQIIPEYAILKKAEADAFSYCPAASGWSETDARLYGGYDRLL
jgi:hypothetical protein